VAAGELESLCLARLIMPARVVCGGVYGNEEVQLEIVCIIWQVSDRDWLSSVWILLALFNESDY